MAGTVCMAYIFSLFVTLNLNVTMDSVLLGLSVCRNQLRLRPRELQGGLALSRPSNPRGPCLGGAPEPPKTAESLLKP